MALKTVSKADILLAISQLQQSGRGQAAIDGLLKWLQNCGLALDLPNQAAVIALLGAVWGPYAGTALELMGAASIGRTLNEVTDT